RHPVSLRGPGALEGKRPPGQADPAGPSQSGRSRPGGLPGPAQGHRTGPEQGTPLTRGVSTWARPLTAGPLATLAVAPNPGLAWVAPTERRTAQQRRLTMFRKVLSFGGVLLLSAAA